MLQRAPTPATRTTPELMAYRRYIVKSTVLSRLTIWIYGGFGILQGALILIADDRRWGSAGYTVIMSVPGAQDIWGWFALLAGALILAGSSTRRFWPKTVGVLLLSLWAGAFGAGALGAIASVPTAGITGPATYFAVALAASVLMFVDERRPDA